MKDFVRTDNARGPVCPSASLVSLPKFNFFGSGKKITIINEGDLPIGSALDWLGINKNEKYLGNCDGEEARNRSEMMRFLVSNQPMFKIIQKLKESSSGIFSTSEKIYRDHYDPVLEHNPFWQAYHELLNYLQEKEKQLPDRLKLFYQALLNAKSLEKDEKEAAKMISSILEEAALFEGLLSTTFNVYQRGSHETKSFHADIKKTEITHIHGYRAFSHALSSVREKKLPKCLCFKGGFWSWLFFWNIGLIYGFILALVNVFSKQAAYRTIVINRAPEVKTDVENWISLLIDKDQVLAEKLYAKNTTLHIYFSYCQNAEEVNKGFLKVKIIGAEAPHSGCNEHRVYFEFSEFEGYSNEWINAIKKARIAVEKELASFEQKKLSFEVAKAISEHHNNSYEGEVIDSEHTDRVHRWAGLSNLYSSKTFRDIIKTMNDLKCFISRHLDDIEKMNDILLKFQNKADELNTKICFPEILFGEKNVIESEMIYPIQLGINHTTNSIKPIWNIPPINGTVVGLSAKNNTAKTTTEEAIPLMIWLAMTFGICFGKGIRFNPKTHLCMALLKDADNGEKGSTAYRHSGKFAAILDEIENVPGKNVLIIIDEIESATNADEGARVGMGVLTCAHAKGASLVFTSQENSLYRMAEKDIGAKTYMIKIASSGDRIISEGLETGGYMDLAKQNGLLKHFKKAGYEV